MIEKNLQSLEILKINFYLQTYQNSFEYKWAFAEEAFLLLPQYGWPLFFDSKS